MRIPRDLTELFETMRQLSTDLQRNDSQQNDETNTRPRRYRRPNLPVLFYSIIGRNWAQALRRTATHPKEVFSVEDISGDSPLHVAVKLDPPIQIVQALMPICNEKNREGATALHVAAAHRCSAGVIKIMVETEYAERKGALTLSLSNRGRTPLHYACSSFRGLDVAAFKVLLDAMIEAHIELEKRELDESFDIEGFHNESEWEDNTEKVNAFTMEDHLGHTPLSLLFKRYRERVKYVIRSLERKSISSSEVAAARVVQHELGSLWLKARFFVCRMAERQKNSQSMNEFIDGDMCPREVTVTEEAARWAAQRHQSNRDDDHEEEDDDDEVGDGTFRLVHASVALAGYGCPIEMIRLAIQVYPKQIAQMDEDGNLPLHIAAVAPAYLTHKANGSNSDEDSLMSSLSTLSGMPSDASKPFQRVIRMLLRFYPEAAQIPHGVSGRLPLILAMDARQRTMDDGIKLLLDAYPAALESKYFDSKLYPYILSTVGKAKEVTVASRKKRIPIFGRKKEEALKRHLPVALFECLKAKPGIVMHALLKDERKSTT